ncbi:MAG: Asp23/Gls24 family envelope stress response protein [Candidatus Dormibacteraeota bacterium]|nr:Asp23/Gls24 family envelope stress response protein [Candidatus Dormibacteraeota bacterium]
MSEQRLHVKLECGVLVSDLLEQVSDGHAGELSPHQAECPFCQRSLGRLAASWQRVERLRAQRVEPTPQLLARVMQRIRAGLDDQRVELVGEPGVTRVSLAVLAALAFWVATAAPGVRQVFVARPGGSVSHEGPSMGGSKRRERLVSADGLSLELEISIKFGFSALVVAEELRRAVIDEVRKTAGLDLARVELTIVDVG